MIEKENDKTAICPSCLEISTANLYFASDGYLNNQNCFSNLNFQSPISTQHF